MIYLRHSFIVLGSICLLFSAGCDRPLTIPSLPGQPRPSDVPIKPQDVTDFAQLYSLNCAGCHGTDGKGSGALALNNPVYLGIVSDATITKVTTLGLPGTLMPAFALSAGGSMTDSQIAIVVSGIRQWATATPPSGSTPPPYAAGAVTGDAARGATAYTTFCQSCHGPEGRGTPKLGSIVDTSFLALVSDQSLRSTIIAGRPDRGHPDWAHCVEGQALTDQQVTDVVTWLANQRSPTPGNPYPLKP